MNSFKNTDSKTWILILIVLLFFSCSDPQIYKSGREWTFIIKVSDKNEFDTLILKTTNQTTQIYQTKINWIYKFVDSTGIIHIINDETGVIERPGNFLSNLFVNPGIWIHPIRSDGLFRLTEMLPFPKIEYPIKIGNTIDWKLTPKKGWKELEGKTVTGSIKVSNKIYYSNPIVQDSCYVLNAIGKSEIGTFTGKYYFNEKYGFVYYAYDFNTIQVELIPVKINF